MKPLLAIVSGTTVAFFIIFRDLVARMWHEIDLLAAFASASAINPCG